MNCGKFEGASTWQTTGGLLGPHAMAARLEGYGKELCVHLDDWWMCQKNSEMLISGVEFAWM